MTIQRLGETNPCIQAFIEYEYTCSGLKPLEELMEFLE